MKIMDQGLFCLIPEFALAFLTKQNLFSPQKELDYRPSFCQYLIICEEEIPHSSGLVLVVSYYRSNLTTLFIGQSSG
jgi:hypothetical protein